MFTKNHFKKNIIGATIIACASISINAVAFPSTPSGYAAVHVQNNTTANIFWSIGNSGPSNCNEPIQQGSCRIQSGSGRDSITFKDGANPSNSCNVEFNVYEGVTHIINSGTMDCEAAYGKGNNSIVSIVETAPKK